jgi:hypothetical protein
VYLISIAILRKSLSSNKLIDLRKKINVKFKLEQFPLFKGLFKEIHPTYLHHNKLMKNQPMRV